MKYALLCAAAVSALACATTAFAAIRWSTSMPASCFRSMARLRLLREVSCQY